MRTEDGPTLDEAKVEHHPIAPPGMSVDAETAVTETVVRHHLRAFLDQKGVPAIVSDYDEDAYFYSEAKVYRGKEEIHGFFTDFLESLPPAAIERFTLRSLRVDRNIAYITWCVGSDIPLGTDTFVVDNGKIASQTFAMYAPARQSSNRQSENAPLHLQRRSVMRIARIVSAALLAAATAVGGLASFAVPASADVPASNPIQYKSQSFWGGSNVVPVTGTVSCPSGSRVVSAGASASGGQLTGIAPDINSFTSATATARAPGYLEVTVGCEAAAALSEVTARTIQQSYGSGFRRGVVYCPAGMRAFGGGGYLVKPFGIGGFSRDSLEMVSNTVSADGTGWTFAAHTSSPNDALVVTTQCAPLRDSYVSQNRITAPAGQRVNTFAPCRPGYVALSGGVYLSKLNGTEEENGFLDYSTPAFGNRWYVDGVAFGYTDGLVALAQCIR